MSEVGGTQQEDAAMIEEVASPLGHRKILKKLMDRFVKKKRCDAKELQPIPESPIDTFEWDEETGFKWETVSYKALNDILKRSPIPILIVFYSNKVPLSYHHPSNEQSKRCVDVCVTVQKLVESVVPDKVKLVKFDIEKSNLDNPLEINHVPTIKLYPGIKGKKKYPVEYFDDPLILSNYERFLKEEGVIKL